MENSPLIDCIQPNYPFYDKQARVSDFIINSKKWNLSNLNNILPKEIIIKIKAILISLTNIGDDRFGD